MSHENQKASIQDILDLELEASKLIDRDAGTPRVQQELTIPDFANFDKSYVVPEIGKRHETNSNWIEVNTVGYFDIEKCRFVSEPRTLSEKNLQDILRLVGLLKADELFMQDGEPLKIKMGHRTKSITSVKYSGDELHDLIGKLVSSSVPGRIVGGESEPFTMQVAWKNKDGKEAQLRFRGNGTRTLGTFGSTNGVTYAIRRLGDEIPTLEQLKIDDEQQRILFPKTGIVMVVGETGSGKSTYLAAVIRRWVTQEDGIVLSTYEYPVEFDYRPIQSPDCVVGQVDLGNALHGSYENAAKDAMRRNSDVILIGEVRDKNSAHGAMNLALSGHLVYCTFHAGSPMEAMERIISYFPADEQQAVRNTLVGTLQAVVCVKLVPTKDDSRVQIRGYMQIDKDVREKMYTLEKDTFAAGVKELYTSKGHTMLADLERYEGIIAPEVYDSYKQIFI